MSESNGYQKLPPGWDCKYDQTTGNCYYINYLTKAMQLEDPRGRSYRQLQNERCSTESIALQQMVSQSQTSHNSSPYHLGSSAHVHPSNNLTAIRAFQERNQQPTLHNISTSPLLSASSRGHLEMSSPLPFQRARLGPNLSRRSTIQETSFTNQAETDAVVTKIQNMFPTADDNHIRLLLKRYMKNIFPKADEMLLLDVLANADNNVQYASEKLISLGYTKREMQLPHKPNNRPPELAQEQAGGDQATQHIPLRPKEYTEEEKAKMQTRLKEKYPQIAERIILMALESVNYAEDRATQILQIVQDEDEQRAQKQPSANPKSLELSSTTAPDQVDGVAGDRQASSTSASKLKPPHKRHILPSINVTTPSTATTQIILDQPEQEVGDGDPGIEEEQQQQQEHRHLSSISSASSSHSYVSPAQSPCYERLTTKSILAKGIQGQGQGQVQANQNHNDTNRNYSISGYLHGSSNASSYSSYSSSMTSSSLASNSNSSSIAKAIIESRARTKTESLKHRQHSSSFGNSQNSESSEFQSIIERMTSLGPNSQLTKGADENLLLADYVTWNGPNTTLLQKQPTQGPDSSLLGDRSYKPAGRNSELCKGAQAGLAKGSIYARGSNKSPNIKCN
ncbi:uncharacterized protein Dana_GF24301, isoform D [Drosophila ananassae]|uniref:Uncharacterized protein, isoform D n=1 Tax=Drosophila ananassae TaxID=7217 RepID=A0A0P9C3G2_DROAN|nr:uncharacterized protein LOC6506934 isoform X2 [Drosophila ananassae]KPU78206.1 uncharacterized protein Dana_GF24301, isoform D [Drosophila ananassae]